VDDEEKWRLLVEEWAVDGIITNDPGRLYEWLIARLTLKGDAAS
jgi:hypothetical protein